MKIQMEHGSGGKATGELIAQIFANGFHNETLDKMEDSAVVPGAGRIAVTTDSFVVTPLEFPGGDIGRLCICGTVNDLLMRGATPKYITCGFILQEGAETEQIQRIVKSMAETAKEAQVEIIAGDTKVVEGNGGLFINTTGVGFVPEGCEISASSLKPGDAVLVSGNLGDHHATILGSRMAIKNHIVSDNAPLGEMVEALVSSQLEIHTLRDVTRGGLATVLKELAEASQTRIEIQQDLLPVNPQVEDFCGLLGLDPLYMGNEGKMVVILPQEQAEEALRLIRQSRYGEHAAMIGVVEKPETEAERGRLVLKTRIGGRRILEELVGEGLPRIC